MALADNRAAGFQMAQQIFGQAQQQVNLQQQHDFMMQKMAGIQGLDPTDIEALLSGDAKARGLAMSRIVQKPNGIDAIQAVSQFMTANAAMTKKGDLQMPLPAMQALIENMAQGTPIPPEYQGMQVPTEMAPGLTALRAQRLSGGVRRDVANTQAGVTEQGNIMEYILGLSKNVEDMRARLGDQPGKNREVAGSAAETFSKSILESLGDPQWPAELDRSVAATVRLFADRAYAAALQDAQASGQAFDESYVQGQLYSTLNKLGVRPGAKEKDLRNAITKMRELMGQQLPTATEQIQPPPQATQGATPGNVTLGNQVLGGASFSPKAATEAQSAAASGGRIVNPNALRPTPQSGQLPDSAASTDATGSKDQLQQQQLAKLSATYAPEILRTAQSGKVIMPPEFERQLRAMGMNNAQIKALVLQMLQQK